MMVIELSTKIVIYTTGMMMASNFFQDMTIMFCNVDNTHYNLTTKYILDINRLKVN